jgi:hypothetical protein
MAAECADVSMDGIRECAETECGEELIGCLGEIQ